MSGRGSPAALRLPVLLDPRALAVAIFVYGIARAASLSITHDEALTYLLHVRASWGAVLAHTAPLASNNHLLNTIMIKALLALLPPTELALRIPALSGLALYLWAAARLTAAAASGFRRPLGFLLLAANPFVLDLLVLSRGYALALGLTLAALALIAAPVPDAANRRPLRTHALAASAAGAAVLANLAFLYSLLAVAAVAAALAIGRSALSPRPRGRIQAAVAAVAPFVAAGALLGLVYTPAVLARISRPLASWGGERGIWADTVPSLAEGVLYGAPWSARWHDALVMALTVAVALVLLTAVVPAVRQGRRAILSLSAARGLQAMVVFTIAWGAQVAAAHLLLGIRYPIDRAAVVLVPCLTLLFVALWETSAPSRGGVLRHALTVVTAGALVHFALCANLSHTYLWRYDADTSSAMRRVAAVAAPLPPASLRLGVSWLLEPAASFYRVTWNIVGLAPITRDDPRSGFDLCLLAAGDREIAGAPGWHTCASFPGAGTTLAVPPGVACPEAL